MTPSPYTEDTLVQQTTAEYLERQLGRESVYAYNNEDFGPESRLGRVDETDPAKPDEELLVDLADAIAFVRAFLDERGASLDDVIRKTGFERNTAIAACKEAANENDETRKRFEVTCREVFKKFRACINVKNVNAHRADRDAIDIVYKSL